MFSGMLTNMLQESHQLSKWHTAFKGKKGLDAWKVAPYIKIKGENKIRRTPGEPITVRRIWKAYNYWIERGAERNGVPSEILVATIATESGGDPNAVRKEPGFINIKKTPNKISGGLMQMLISTARHISESDLVSLRELKDPVISIIWGAEYYSDLKGMTGYDPVLCAAAYNSGGVYYSPNKKFGLRCYTKGSYNHILRFIAWYNDFVYVLLNEDSSFTNT